MAPRPAPPISTPGPPPLRTGDFERAVNLQRRAVTAAEALENPPYLRAGSISSN